MELENPTVRLIPGTGTPGLPGPRKPVTGYLCWDLRTKSCWILLDDIPKQQEWTKTPRLEDLFFGIGREDTEDLRLA